MTPDSLSQMLSDFLMTARAAVVIEDGSIAFDLAAAKYSISGEHHKCLIHLYSNDRNAVRRVLDAEIKGTTLRLQVQRMGQTKPTRLDFCRDRDQRSPAARRSARIAYEPRLRRALEKYFYGWTVVRLTTSVDLEHSFGPAYLRGWLRQGQRALAILAVNDQETQSTIDGALTSGILWLDACRQAQQARQAIEGLVIILPQGTATLTQQRMVQLHPSAAKWSLYEFQQSENVLTQCDLSDRGNLATRLVRAIDDASTHSRFKHSISRIREILPQAEVVALSAAEISLRCNGLEFAQARIAFDPKTFQSLEEIVFGMGAEQRVLSDENVTEFADLIRLAASVRNKNGPKNHRLWRMDPERWLEASITANVAALDGRLRTQFVYPQVPAFAAADRAMIDILAETQDGRLAVIELKADEDIHLPLQGVDYWSRVDWHQNRGELTKFGYFPGRQLSSQKPLLLLVAPALHVHPTTDTILRYLRPEVDWEVVGIAENWREEIKVIFRKKPTGDRALRQQLALPA